MCVSLTLCPKGVFFFIQVSIELSPDNKHSEKSKSKLAWSQRLSSQAAPTHETEARPKSQAFVSGRQELPASFSEDSRLKVLSPQKPPIEPSFHPSLFKSSHKAWNETDEDSEVLLHTILMVPEGKNFNCGPMQAPSVYLNCKLFWCDEMARSVVSWGQANPTFNFIQVSSQVKSSNCNTNANLNLS